MSLNEHAGQNSSNTLTQLGRPQGFLSGLTAAFQEVSKSRDLLRLLVRREIKAKYKDSSLGLLWSLVRPVTQLLIFYIFVGEVLGAARSIPNFAIFIFTNLTVWFLFADLISGGTNSITGNAGLVKKIYLPREIFPLAASGVGLFNFAIQFGILLVATAIFGVFPLHWEILFLPLSLALVFTYGIALALLLGALNVYFRDTQHLVEVGIMVGFWLSPIVYSLAFVHSTVANPVFEAIYLANPMTLAIVGMQRALWISGVNDPSQYWPPDLGMWMTIALLIGLLLLVFSQRIFSRLQGNFAQEL